MGEPNDPVGWIRLCTVLRQQVSRESHSPLSRRRADWLDAGRGLVWDPGRWDWIALQPQRPDAYSPVPMIGRLS